MRDRPGEGMYEVPAPFADDWLNWWWDRREGGKDDYRFVYIGTQVSCLTMRAWENGSAYAMVVYNRFCVCACAS